MMWHRQLIGFAQKGAASNTWTVSLLFDLLSFLIQPVIFLSIVTSVTDLALEQYPSAHGVSEGEWRKRSSRTGGEQWE